jgi:uncharacterized protein YbjT (DUF2867 family)
VSVQDSIPATPRTGDAGRTPPTLVVGATGRVGGRIARLLLSRGERVRILTRPGRNVDDLVAVGAEPVVGDLADPGSLVAACDGASAVIVTANAARPAGSNTSTTVDDLGVGALVDASVRAGARRFIHVSADVARIDSPIELLRAKAAAELHVSRSGLAFTVLAPDMFMESWLTGVVLGPLEAGEPVLLVRGAPARAFVSELDVAAIAVATLDAPWTINGLLPVGGPDVVSWSEVVDACARIRGQAIDVTWLTRAEADALPSSRLAMLSLTGRTPPGSMRVTADRLGIRLATVADFLADRCR